jgi:hypothetical protein
MKRKLKHGLRKAVFLLLVSSCGGAWTAGQQACLQLDKTVCRSGEVRFDIDRFDDRTALKRQPAQSSAFDPVAKLVSMLP